MNTVKSKSLLRYLYENLSGSFLGFLIGSMAASLVSRFFATRSIHNLWGLTSHKTILDKSTYGRLEWLVSVFIGFVVFEIVTKWAKKRLAPFKIKLLRFIAQKRKAFEPLATGLHEREA